jgi:hypothetical protein
MLGKVTTSDLIAFNEEIRVGNAKEMIWEAQRRRKELIGGLDLTAVLDNLGL